MGKMQLMEGIVELSESDNWNDALEEWLLDSIEISEEPDECLCGKYPIKELCFLRNHINGNLTLVGNVCVNRFMGIESQPIFHSIKKIQKNNKKSINEHVINYIYKKEWINNWEKNFYLNIKDKRKLTFKQRQKKQSINQKILYHFNQDHLISRRAFKNQKNI